jgi:hypothetical protein
LILTVQGERRRFRERLVRSDFVEGCEEVLVLRGEFGASAVSRWRRSARDADPVSGGASAWCQHGVKKASKRTDSGKRSVGLLKATEEETAEGA